MKNLKKAFLPLLGMGLLASCSNDNFDDPQVPAGQEGDMYLTLNIRNLNTRTATPNQGKEEGQDVENTITSGLIILTHTDNNVVAAAEINNTEIKGIPGKYAASFKMVRQTLLTDLGNETSKEYRIWVIANPTSDMVAYYTDPTTATKGIQKTFELTTTDAADKYWSNNNFLMTNADFSSQTINKEDIAPGKHSTESDALNLGEVTVQRAMSRLDLATEAKYTVFNSTNNNSSLADVANVTVTIDGVALVNEATVANMFKEVGDKHDTYNENTSVADTYSFFRKETASNWVFSPTQTSYLNPLFSNNTQVDLSTLNYTTVSTITSPDAADWSKGESDTSAPADNYFIWRYAMENTIYDAADPVAAQKNGVTTGVVFRAKMTGTPFTNANGKEVYVYNNRIIGDMTALQQYTYENATSTDPATQNWQKQVALRYADAKNAATTDGVLDNDKLKEELVKANFAIYEADDDGNYYCYYIYWNRHNDNGNNNLMGIMEFATVRNNVYKLAVKSIRTLGHPGKPGNDPDPTDPEDPDETDDLWGEVTCIVLPWEVRINNIEF